MSFYKHHVFFCTNQRPPGERECCQNHNASALRDYVKARIKSLGYAGPGQIRINNAGCLDRCSEGPVLVVYPEGTWYTYVDQADLDDIIETHLIGGKVVERLKI